MFDTVIRGGNVVDGTGAPARTADVAVQDGRIAEVGRVTSRGHREVQADGLLVTPGFVDFHTHYDGQVTWDPYLTPSSWHGCTTVVMGSCGVGFAPVAPDKHDWLIGLMEGVEDIPGAALAEGIRWGWESFPEYLDALEAMPHAIDFGTQIPHGALRAYVMGERGAANEAANADDIQAMYRLVREALEAGALGFSTSRTVLHKSIDGVPVPGTFATPAEIFGIGRALRDAQLGIFQLAGEHLAMASEYPWIRALADEIQRPVMFNLSQTDQDPHLWKEMLGLIEQAGAEGAPVYAQSAGRAIGVVMGWECSAHPFLVFPSFLELMQLSREERLAALKTPEVRARILADTPVSLGEFEDFVTRSFHKMFVLDDSVDYEPSPSRSVAAIAQASGRRPEEVAYDLLMENDGQGFLYFPLFNYADGNLDLLHTLHSSDQVFMGLSDAGAHCGAICDGGMPTFMLTHWTRDRTRGQRLSLERIVQRQTRDTARIYGFHDRGVLAPGYKADINVIDYDNLRFHRPQLAYDLPAGGRRLVQRAEGYKATICSGTFIVENDTLTEALPGKLLRGPQPSPVA